MDEGTAAVQAYVERDGDWFIPTPFCRGPWDADSCHAGPPTGLLARAMERALLEGGSPHRLVRLSVELTRPVPMAGFRVEAAIVRAGRSVTMLRAVLLDDTGTERIEGRGLAMRADPVGPLPTSDLVTPSLAEAEPGSFPISRSLHGLPAFSSSTELRYPPGDGPTKGPTVVWMRTVPLVAGEVPSPFQRICPLADCGNALSRNAEPWEVGFVNPDLTIALHRAPQGGWLGSSSRSHWEPEGIGLAHAQLFDEHGPVGVALQTLLLTPQG